MTTSRISAGLFSCVFSSSVRSSHTIRSNLQQSRLLSTLESLPKIARPTTWSSIIPKSFRNREHRQLGEKKPKAKEWNPASFFIIIFLLIGSQAIHLLVLRNDFANYTRKADAKLELLRGVIEKMKRGEHVDVEKLLGTGDDAKEREWEEVLREIEEEDSLWHQRSAEKPPSPMPFGKETVDNGHQTSPSSPHAVDGRGLGKDIGSAKSRFY